MMFSQEIGQISVKVSFACYMLMLLPQIYLNIRRHSLDGFSWGMHLILLGSSICDSFYAFANRMPWQYYAVDLVLIALLGLQHVQYWRYQRDRLPRSYGVATIGLASFAIIGTILFQAFPEKRGLFALLGYVSMVGFFTASLPQIIANHRLGSAEGAAVSFIVLQTLGLMSDTVSAYALHWGLPNRIGAPASLVFQVVLLLQLWFYRAPSAGDRNALRRCA
jgi:hypothetical protein